MWLGRCPMCKEGFLHEDEEGDVRCDWCFYAINRDGEEVGLHLHRRNDEDNFFPRRSRWDSLDDNDF